MGRRIRFAPEAELDLDDIRKRSRREFGAKQCDTFTRSLFDTFELLANHAGIGFDRSDIANGLRTFPHRPYMIFYRPIGDQIVILRVLHGRRDVRAALEDLED